MSLNMTASSFYYVGDWLYIMWILCDSTEALLKREFVNRHYNQVYPGIY